MLKKETLIVLTNYLALVKEYKDEDTRKINGILCAPMQIGLRWCLPLGWEDALDNANIPYTTELVVWEEEEI